MILIERAYYRCDHCHWSACLHDGILDLDERGMTPAVRELVTLAGTVASFQTVAGQLLDRLGNLRLSESKVLRTVEEVGAQVQEQLEAGQPLGEATDWNWSWDAQGQSVAYIQVDATGIGIQGANASKAEGQMIYLGAILNAGDPEAKIPRQARYVTKLHELQPLGDLLRRNRSRSSRSRREVLSLLIA